ncbi:hypothetical protein CPLU01_04220 [Colletotrichum plurivorum]|uniref:Uncharacterized protein n=1 Tax=Colletotrichum plurivorum TaxID=2175906 RepID=A0A8H6KPZ8_9PEZI|nr:hypothetical protein CPLU01_04220 [Colletotrichum plurivorum]
MRFTSFMGFTSEPGVGDLDPDSDTPEGRATKRYLHHFASHPEAGRIYWGKVIERPEEHWLFIDMDHALLRPPNIEYHPRSCLTDPWPPDVLAEAPVTQVLMLFFPSDLDDAAFNSLTIQFEGFKTKALDQAPDCRGVAYGWSTDGDVPVMGQPGRTGTVLMAFVGWPSVEAHVAFRQTELFRENIALLKGMKDLIIKLDYFHLACKSLEVPDN